MIYTITLSPSIDYKFMIDKFEFNKTLRMKNAHLEAGGKGINVAMVLDELNIPNEAIFTIGGKTEALFLDLLSNKIKKRKIFKTKNNVRINIKGHSNFQNLEINDWTKPFSKNVISNISNYLKNNVQNGDYVLFSGSPPINLPKDIFAQLVSKITKSIFISIDATSKYVFPLLNKGIFLIKPNKQELQDFTNEPINTVSKIDNAAQKLINLGIKHVLVSLDKDGSILYSNHLRNHIRINEKIDVIDAIGAGDSMVAGFIAAHSQGLNLQICHKWGVAAATATISSNKLVNKNSFNKWLKRII